MSRMRVAVTFVAGSLFASGSALAQPAPAQPAPTVPESLDDGRQNPGKAADPPLLPPPNGGGAPPTSTSGTDITPSVPAAPAAGTEEREAEAKQEARIRALEQRIQRDEGRIRHLEDRLRLFKNLRFEAFIQPQLLVQSYNTAASPNLQADGTLPAGIQANDTIAKADGTTTNGTFFRVRRARLRTFYGTEVMRLFLQIDAFPAGGIGPGIGTILRNAEATGIARWSNDIRTEFTAGLFFTPFRKELLEASLYRPFIERTWFVQSCFPLERDYGVHAQTIAFDDSLVVDLSVVNGQRLGEATFTALPDLNRSKDFIAYVTYKLAFVTLGASGYMGRGQVVDPVGFRFKQFTKWAVNYEASAEERLLRRIGETRLSAAFTLGQNMDAGVIYPFAVPRIPTHFTDDVTDLDERALYVRLEQDIGKHLLVGYRYDMYSPDTGIDNNARDTHAFLAVWKFSPNLRWMNELDWSIDNVHPIGSAPPSKHIVSYSSVLQAMF